MQVFKAYFKVINKNKMNILIYFAVMISVSAIMTSVVFNESGSTFTATKSRIAIFNEDTGAPLTAGMIDCLSANAKIVTIDDNSTSIQDALFYGNVDYILRIPAGFAEGFMKGEAPQLEKTVTGTTASGAGIDLLINRYLSIAGIYRANVSGADQKYIAENTALDLKNGADVRMEAKKEQINTSKLAFYFMYSAYPLMAILIMGVTTIMMVFNETELSKRNRCSPVSSFKMNLQMILGNAVFAIAVWFVISAYNMLIYGKESLNAGSALLCINALMFTLVGLSIGFLGGRFINGPAAQSAFANIVSLGMSFISGVFVQQELLGSTVLKIASFTPAYWYVKAVNNIGGLADYSPGSLKPAFGFMLIQLGFAAAIFIVAMTISKQKRLSKA